MSADILIKYQGFPALEIEFDPSLLANDYKELIHKNSNQPAISRDPCQYTEEYLRKLAQQAREVLGWDWVKNVYDLDTTTILHKDIEVYLGQGFDKIPEEHDRLCHELHYALHAVQLSNDRGNWIQVEWFNNDYIDMPDDFKFCHSLKFGDVKLQNPYVGHDPAFLFKQDDWSNVEQTCKFHDIVRPGLNIMIQEYSISNIDWYLKCLQRQAPSWYFKHGPEKILRYTGWPKVGRVLNLEVLKDIANSPLFVLENVTVV